MYRVTFRVSSEDEDYFSMIVSKEEYQVILQFISELNIESSQVSIGVYDIQEV